MKRKLNSLLPSESGYEERNPLLREGGVAAPKEKWPRSLFSADGVVVSSHRLSKPFGMNKR